MIPLIFSPIAGILIYLSLRKLKNNVFVYCSLLLLAFILVYPEYFTDLKFTSSLLRDILLILFFGISIAALIQKGFYQKITATIFILAILLKGPLFGIYFPSTFDISKKAIVKKFDFGNYAIQLERTKQSTLDDIYQWKGKKYLFGKFFYKVLWISDSLKTNDKCIQTLYISRIDSYEKGTTTLEQIINYDTCGNNIIQLERH